MRHALGAGLGLVGVFALVVAVQGGTAPAPVAAALGQAAPVTQAPVATTAPAAPTTTAAPASRAHNAPGREKDAPAATSSAKAAAPARTSAAPSYFASCDDVRAAGRAPLHRGDPGYRSGLDRDGDGTACEPTR